MMLVFAIVFGTIYELAMQIWVIEETGMHACHAPSGMAQLLRLAFFETRGGTSVLVVVYIHPLLVGQVAIAARKNPLLQQLYLRTFSGLAQGGRCARGWGVPPYNGSRVAAPPRFSSRWQVGSGVVVGVGDVLHCACTITLSPEIPCIFAVIKSYVVYHKNNASTCFVTHLEFLISARKKKHTIDQCKN